MDKAKQVELLAAAIGNLEQTLFLETINEAFWGVQALTGNKQYQQILGATQAKTRMIQAQILYYKEKLVQIEKGDYVYEPFKKK